MKTAITDSLIAGNVYRVTLERDQLWQVHSVGYVTEG